MDMWIVLVAGISVGWVIEWIIDWLYWRRGLEELYATQAHLRRQLAAQKQEAASLRRELADLHTQFGILADDAEEDGSAAVSVTDLTAR